MNIDIRRNVINKLKNDSENDIINTINEAVQSKEEIVLPGLGVMIELFWNNLDNNEKINIASIIRNNIK